MHSRTVLIVLGVVVLAILAAFIIWGFYTTRQHSAELGLLREPLNVLEGARQLQEEAMESAQMAETPSPEPPTPVAGQPGPTQMAPGADMTSDIRAPQVFLAPPPATPPPTETTTLSGRASLRGSGEGRRGVADLFSVRALLDAPGEEAELTSSDGLWQGPDRVALVAAGQWIQVTCRQASTRVGVHFVGDENDGWARVLVDDVEMWQGNTYGAVGLGFNQVLEITQLPLRPHRLRVEAIGRVGIEDGSDHVTITSFSCGGISGGRLLFLPVVHR